MKASWTVHHWDLKENKQKKCKRILQKTAHINVSSVLVLKFCFLFLFFYLEYCTVEVNLPYMVSPYIKSMKFITHFFYR